MSEDLRCALVAEADAETLRGARHAAVPDSRRVSSWISTAISGSARACSLVWCAQNSSAGAVGCRAS